MAITQRAWTPDETARLYHLAFERRDLHVIAAEFGRTGPSVRNKAKRLGLNIKYKNKSWTRADVEVLGDRKLAGYSMLRIAGELERTVRACVSKCRELGLTPPKGTHVLTWTEEEVVDLKSRAEAGESSALIAKALGRTKNSIIGKCNRDGIQLTGITHRPYPKGRRPKRYRPRFRAPQLDALAIAPPKPFLIPSPGKTPLLDLKPHHCRWVTSTQRETGIPALFCAKHRVPGEAWCADHVVQIYRKDEVRP